MTKTITSPVQQWPGEVVLYDPLNLPQEAAWEEAVAASQMKRSLSGMHAELVPGILRCVKEWHLGGDFPARPTLANWPTKPREARAQLLKWLVDEISAVYAGDEDETTPNG